jgi:hypothetical protein
VDRDPSKPDPYKVNYDEPFRQQSEGGVVEYSAPAHAVANAPATSWDAAAYKPVTPEPTRPTTAVAETTPATVEPPAPAPAPVPIKHKPAKAKKVVKAVKKPSPDQVASSR